MLEADYKKSIRDFLEEEGALLVPIITGEMGIRGDPDIFGVYMGMPFVIEAKIAPNRPTKIQLHRMLLWGQAGAVTIIASYPEHNPATILDYLEFCLNRHNMYKMYDNLEGFYEWFMDTSARGFGVSRTPN